MVLILLACQPRVPTSEIRVDLQVVGQGLNEADFQLNMLTAEGEAFELRDDDRLVISLGDETEDVDPQAAWTQEVPSEAFEVMVRLERAWDLSGELWVSVPTGLELLEPVDGDASFDPLTENIDLAWSPSGSEDQMSYTVEGDCVFLNKRFFGDAGVARIAPWAWEDHLGVQAGCNTELSLRREPIWQGSREWDGFSSVTSDVERQDSVSLRLAP